MAALSLVFTPSKSRVTRCHFFNSPEIVADCRLNVVQNNNKQENRKLNCIDDYRIFRIGKNAICNITFSATSATKYTEAKLTEFIDLQAIRTPHCNNYQKPVHSERRKSFFVNNADEVLTATNRY